MRARSSFVSKSLLASFAFSLSALCASAQVNTARPLITQPMDETKVTVLHGNTHPLARAEFDRGAAPSSLPMERTLLVLKRSPEQETALETLLAQQQDKSSPNYHKWLTPAEFGAQFGLADQDIQTITSWLKSHGFQVAPVSNGRTVIEFSGNAGQVQEAFHAPIHKYVVNGEQHWANANDPSIPTALTAAVAGVDTLHNFFPKPMNHIRGPLLRSGAANQSSARPQFSFAATGPCSLVQFLGLTPSGNECFMLGPTDFATIYNVLPLWNQGIDGTGVKIAIVGDSNINVQDDATFRSIFGLPAKAPTVTIAEGSDPGKTADESEAILDVEWSGAVAKNANINLVIAASTNTTFGGDTAATYIVNNSVAPILSESFGACEPALAGQNSFYNTTWQGAVAVGITVIVASGDNGSAACDIDEVNGPPSQPALDGLQVNGIASTPFNVAVGGTDFNDTGNPTQYWSTSNNPTTMASALGYVPEATWNDSCTNAIFVTLGYGANAEGSCNDSTGTLKANGVIVPVGGSGGASGLYQKPCWQGGAITPACTQNSGITTPSDGARDLPDISLFAGDGTIAASSYYFCESDLDTNNAMCSLNGQIFGAGGTSVSTQVFAGIMALLNQKYEDKQGLINPALYTLAASQVPANCNSLGPPMASCVFNDITLGTIAMPCGENSLNCTVNNPGDTVGVLTGWDTGIGYDLATGLGSVNTANLVNATSAWTSTTGGADFTLSLNSTSLTVGQGATSPQVTLTVTPEGGFTGNVTVAVSGLPSETTSNITTNPVMGGSGATMITFTTIAPSMLAPIRMPNRIGWPGIGTMIALVFAFCTCLLLLGSWNRNRRWTVALALAAFAFVISAGCGGAGGGGGRGGNPGKPIGTTAVLITATSGSIQRSVVVNLTVN